MIKKAEENKILLLELGRGLAAILVVLYHMNNYYFNTEKYWLDSLLGGLFRFGHSGVEFFFVLSGFIMIWAHKNYIDNPKSIKVFIKKRFLRIYPLVWLTVGISLVLYIISGTGKEEFRDPLYAIQFFLLFGKEPLGGINFPTWTLWHENIFYLFCVLIFANARFGLIALSIWTIISVFTAILGYSSNSVFYAIRPLNALFSFGVIIAFFLMHRNCRFYRITALLGVFLFFYLGIDSNKYPENMFFYTLGFGFSSALIILGSVEIERSSHLSIPSYFSHFGTLSYPLYLTHMITLPVLAKILLFISAPVWMNPIVAAIIMLSASISVAVFTHVIFEKPVSKWLKGKIGLKMSNKSMT